MGNEFDGESHEMNSQQKLTIALCVLCDRSILAEQARDERAGADFSPQHSNPLHKSKLLGGTNPFEPFPSHQSCSSPPKTGGDSSLHIFSTIPPHLDESEGYTQIKNIRAKVGLVLVLDTELPTLVSELGGF